MKNLAMPNTRKIKGTRQKKRMTIPYEALTPRLVKKQFNPKPYNAVEATSTGSGAGTSATREGEFASFESRYLLFFSFSWRAWVDENVMLQKASIRNII